MTGPNDNQSETDIHQDSFEFEEYITHSMESVDADDVNHGDLVYFVTESGSTYILEVEDTGFDFISGLVSRRGESIDIGTSNTLSNLDSVPAKLYAGYKWLSTEAGALVCPEDSENFRTSQLRQLMIVKFNPFDTTT